jgi:cell division control protein 45
MDMDLKRQLQGKLEAIAPEYGMVELTYPSFMRLYGFKSHPLSAADAVEAVSALLDIAGGVRMEVEIEGARNGGEWFGGGKVWEAPDKVSTEERGKIALVEGVNHPHGARPQGLDQDGGESEIGGNGGELEWWVRNFWTAFDALTE